MRSFPVVSSFLVCLVGFSAAATQVDSASLVTISTGASATGAAALDLEDERAKCFQSCYQKYGNFKSCTRGKDKVLECWCNDSVDWVEREEDCVWDVCGVSAYNEYGNVLRRVCETVTASSDAAAETGSTTADDSSTTVPVDTTQTSMPDATSTESEETAATTSDGSNNGSEMGWRSGVTAAILVGTIYIVRMSL
ncbi:hypothetical protein NW762_001518 [Fusarium torreyae]|uniref:Extracellular membrane protein CFEM domain-containing protein n=1 Tax=Fusarium torreyae TaxID=1237075 RepID=A0A9W8SCN3_9HYPO|nr:hypothetical protein NW762_001518 [Fusarium torreyae]